jgi:hypothetical protein
MEIFQSMKSGNGVYANFVRQIDASSITDFSEIPLLPIEFFKSHRIQHPTIEDVPYFESSSTTGIGTSKRYLTHPEWYHQAIEEGFERVFGSTQNYAILALLPGYLNRPNASLIYMVNRLIQATGHPKSGFYLDNYAGLAKAIDEIRKTTPERRVFLWGVTFGLLDLLDHFPGKIQPDIVLETGGMKGRRKEIIAEELHQILKSGFHVSTIYGEYGMTELYSQAYGSDGLYKPPPWMKVVPIREDNPFESAPHGKTCRLGIIDLANRDACPFLLTSDLGRVFEDGSFQVLGRMDHSDVRGCSQMV